MDAVAIIPVKSFAHAKSRLDAGRAAREAVCETMLKAVLDAAVSSQVSATVVVTRDARAASVASRAGAEVIDEPREAGVNVAVSLADDVAGDYGSSLVIPQDIPLVEAGDIGAILRLAPQKGTLVVPSRRLDGTNALVRSPPCAHETHYDEDSHRIHVATAQAAGLRTTLAMVRRAMLDVDTREDLDYVIAQPDKPSLSESLRAALGARD